MIKALLIYCSGAIALLAILSLVGCQCPEKNAPLNPDGSKPKCRYVGPNVTASLGFHGVSLSATLWTGLQDNKPLGPITLPETFLGVPIGTK